MSHTRRPTGYTGYQDKPGWMSEFATPRGYWVRGDTFHLYCYTRGCGINWLADLQTYIARGWGDVELMRFKKRWRCPACGGREISMSRGTRPDHGPHIRDKDRNRPVVTK